MYYLSLAATPIGVFLIYRFTLVRLAEIINYSNERLAEIEGRKPPLFKISLSQSILEVYFVCCLLTACGIVVGQRWERDRADFSGHCKEVAESKYFCDYSLDDLRSGQ